MGSFGKLIGGGAGGSIKGMKVLDLFSGIGGFSLGLHRAGMKTVAFCEVDLFCRKVLAKHWPNVRIHDDVRTLDGNEYRGTVDVVCGGFPCQPFSVAGKRAGKDDDRHLWPEMLRIIREVQPSYVIGENVAGFVNMELDNCLSDLEAIGYACGAFVIPACAVDAQHRRDRVWILAHSNGDSESISPINAEARSKPATNVGDTSSQSGRSRKPSEGSGRLGMERPVLAEARRQEASDQSGGSGKNVSNANSASEQGRRLSIGVHAQYSDSDGRSDESGRSAPSKWKPEPGVGRVVNGVPRRMDRLKSLGNAVVPQVVEQIGRVIMEDAWARSNELNMMRSSQTSLESG